jgi:hypothetical protein
MYLQLLLAAEAAVVTVVLEQAVLKVVAAEALEQLLMALRQLFQIALLVQAE